MAGAALDLRASAVVVAVAPADGQCGGDQVAGGVEEVFEVGGDDGALSVRGWSPAPVGVAGGGPEAGKVAQVVRRCEWIGAEAELAAVVVGLEFRKLLAGGASGDGAEFAVRPAAVDGEAAGECVGAALVEVLAEEFHGWCGCGAWAWAARR